MSCTSGYDASDIAVVSRRPSRAHSLSVWMSCNTCSNSKPRVSIAPAASAQNGNVTVTALARRLQVSDPSASAMVKKLAALELARHERYRGVELTDAGERVALEVIRHHRLLELYLAETLGLHIDDVHDEADRLEHALSEELEGRIDRVLGYPTHDPHGDPIPDADLNWPEEQPA